MDFIVKNPSETSSVTINDLGIIIDPLEERDLLLSYTPDEINESIKLRDYLVAGTLIRLIAGEEIPPEEAYDDIQNLVTIHEATYDHTKIATAVQKFTDFEIKVYIQDEQPVLSANERLAVWEDTTDDSAHLVYKDSNGNTKTVEFR